MIRPARPYMPVMGSFEVRQVEGFEDEDDDASEDLICDWRNGYDITAALVLQGHHLALLATLERARVRTDRGDVAAAVAKTVLSRLRCRRGRRRELKALRAPGANGFAKRLRAAAAELMTVASRSASLEAALGEDAARELRADPDAWLTTVELSATDLAHLAAHVAAGGEAWVGLGRGRAFLRRGCLASQLDPAATPYLAFETSDVPPAVGECAAVSRPVDPDSACVLDPLHLLCRDGGLLLCHGRDTYRGKVTFAEESRALRLALTRSRTRAALTSPCRRPAPCTS